MRRMRTGRAGFRWVSSLPRDMVVGLAMMEPDGICDLTTTETGQRFVIVHEEFLLELADKAGYRIEAR